MNFSVAGFGVASVWMNMALRRRGYRINLRTILAYTWPLALQSQGACLSQARRTNSEKPLESKQSRG